MLPKPPQGFLGAPSFHPQQQRARTVEVKAKKTHLDEPTMTVSHTREAFPSLALVNTLTALLQAKDPQRYKHALSDGWRVDLIPPRYGRGLWLLDCNPTVGVPLTHTKDTRPRFKSAHSITKAHLTVCRSAGKVDGKHAPLVCEEQTSVTLVLVDEDPDHPGVFRFKVR